jgi:hypothetical protein
LSEELWLLHIDKRPTEWLAVFCMMHGWLPILALGNLDQLVLLAPKWAPERAAVDDPTLGQSPYALKTCPECGNDYPPTVAYWYTNGKYGLYSVCRQCKKGAERKRYQGRKRCPS